MTVHELLEQLKEAGADAIESSPRESETDLTHTEIAGLHRQIDAADLATIAKVELTAPTHGPGEPQWDSFLKRVAAFARTALETGGLTGLSIETSPGSFVTATEYVRAVALARLAARGVPSIIAPLPLIPTLSPLATGQDVTLQHPAEKLAALCAHYGAGDLGAIDVETLNPVAILKQIRAAGGCGRSCVRPGTSASPRRLRTAPWRWRICAMSRLFTVKSWRRQPINLGWRDRELAGNGS